MSQNLQTQINKAMEELLQKANSIAIIETAKTLKTNSQSHRNWVRNGITNNGISYLAENVTGHVRRELFKRNPWLNNVLRVESVSPRMLTFPRRIHVNRYLNTNSLTILNPGYHSMSVHANMDFVESRKFNRLKRLLISYGVQISVAALGPMDVVWTPNSITPATDIRAIHINFNPSHSERFVEMSDRSGGLAWRDPRRIQPTMRFIKILPRLTELVELLLPHVYLSTSITGVNYGRIFVHLEHTAGS